MSFIEYIKDFWREEKVKYLISCTVVTAGAIIIQAALAHKVDFTSLVIWLPGCYALMFILALGIKKIFWG